MSTKLYEAVPAVYHNGYLDLLEPLDLPEGTSVQITIELSTENPQRNGGAVHHSIPFLPASRLKDIAGLIALGGDALEDSEALYDPDWY